MILSRTYVRTSEMMWSEVAGDVVALDPQAGVCFGMEEVSAVVWRLLAEPRTGEAICTVLLAQYDVDAETCRGEVEALLETMLGERLIEVID